MALEEASPAPTDLTAVVLHYRNWPLVADTIRSLRAQTVPVPVVLVDNASGDGSVDGITKEFPGMRVVQSPVNGGYAAGMNLGRQQVPVGDVLFLTHEVLLAPDAVAELRRGLQDDVGMVGPLLFDRREPKVVFSSGGFVNSQGDVGHHEDVPAGPRDVDWLDGSCLLVRREALDAVGPIDEDFFLYFEEADFAVRMLRAGWRVHCVPTAHAWQQPGSVPYALYTRNWLRFLSRNYGRRAVGHGTRVILGRSVTAVRQRRPTKALMMTCGLVGYALHVPPRWLKSR